jgi:hypothetical protein
VNSESEQQPGAPAPATGRYAELNVLGARTGRVQHVVKGDSLPGAPLGFSWRLIEDMTVGTDR